jgi:uncharacterized protein YndB with AHSA1/START domain
MTTTRRGDWTRIDGRAAIRFERELAHSPERVWHAIVDPAELTAWFPCRIDGDLTTVGAELRFIFDDDAATDEITTGRVLEVEDASRLRFSWADEELRIELEPVGDDGSRTRLVFSDLMPPDHEPAAARTAAGWHSCLADLDDFLARGTRNARGHEPDAAWRGLYDAYVADGVPHGAPLPDGSHLD